MTGSVTRVKRRLPRKATAEVSAKRCSPARLDQDHAARDRRVEDATAVVLLQLEERTAAQEAVQAASVGIGAALRRLLNDEAIAPEGVGRLVELTVSEVGRLARALPTGSLASGEVAGDGFVAATGGRR